MRTALAALVLVSSVACATEQLVGTGLGAGLAQQPVAWSAAGAKIVVDAPPSTPDWNGFGKPEDKQTIKSGVEAHLAANGFTILARARNQGELHLTMTSMDDTDLRAAVDRDGLVVGQFDLRIRDLPCDSMWGSNQAENLQCYSTSLAEQVAASPAVRSAAEQSVAAAAPQQQPPQQAPAVPAPASAQASAPARQLTGKLAVLDLRNLTTDLNKQNAQYFTDVVRQATLRREPQLDVMTRENLLVLLQASGKKLEECEGECEVDTGRRIGADLIVSGEIQKVGTRLKISLRLHETKEGRLLGSSIASGKSIDELDENAAKAADELYSMVR